MLSGGLDSTLAAHILKNMGVEIQGVNFSTGFCITDHHRKLSLESGCPRFYQLGCMELIYKLINGTR